MVGTNVCRLTRRRQWWSPFVMKWWVICQLTNKLSDHECRSPCLTSYSQICGRKMSWNSAFATREIIRSVAISKSILKSDSQKSVYLAESSAGAVCQGSSAVSIGSYKKAIVTFQTLGKRIKTHFNQTDIEKSLAEKKAFVNNHERKVQSPRLHEFWTGEKFIG